MDLHGGSISVHSEGEGKGTTFTINLPVFRRSKSVVTESPPDSQCKNCHLHSISLVHRVMSSECNYATTTGILPQNIDAASKHGSLHVIRRSSKIFGSNYKLDAMDEVKAMRRERQSTKNTFRFLLVDDVSLTRKMMRRLINDRSSTIDEAGDGQQAVDMLKISCDTGTPYDIVLMDYQMPIMDGPSAAQAMRLNGFSGLIIGITGHGLQEGEQFLLNGANSVLTKPVNLAELDKILSSGH